MAQHDYSIANQSGAAFRTDLNDALSAIVSSNSGAAAPATTYAYMPWADTTNGVYKIRNATNNGWVSLYQFDGAWSTLTVRRNTAEDGIILQGRTGGTGTFSVTVTPPTLTASRTLTLADGNTTLTAGTMVPTSQVATTSAAGIVQLTDSVTSTSTTTAATPAAVKKTYDETCPPGAVQYFARSTAPTGWVKANGAELSKTVYAALFAAIGTTFGETNGSGGAGTTHFRVPDLRGEFIRAWIDDRAGFESGRTFGSTQTSANLSHSHTATTDGAGSHFHSGTTALNGAHTHTAETRGGPATGGTDSTRLSRGFNDGGTSQTVALDTASTHSHTFSTDTAAAHTHTLTTATSGGDESRPRNIALLACIKI